MLLAGRRLNGEQKQRFREALDAAFDYNDLNLMLSDNFDKKITDIIMPTGINFPTILGAIIEQAEKESWTAQLLQAVLSRRPEDSQLITFAQQFGPLLITPPLKELVFQRTGFERVVTPAPMHEYDNFLQGLWECGSKVCRIKANGRHVGTGFLVGPDLVMTCYHVWEAGQSPEEFKCSFDHGPIKERTYGLAEDYRIDISRYNPEEGLLNGKASTPDELDYVLLRLNGAPGNEPTLRLFQEKPSQRGWITPCAQEYTFPYDSPLYILHYPQLYSSDDAQKLLPVTLKLSQEEHAHVENDGIRVKYTTNTESGSSGSPCFNANWELVAMHHFGDPNKPPQYNQGIPFAAIKKSVERKHKGIFISFSRISSGASTTNGHEAAENMQPVPGAYPQNQVSPSVEKQPPLTQQESAVSTSLPPKRRNTRRKPKKDNALMNRSALLMQLSRCPAGIFDMIVFNCRPPVGVLSGREAPQSTRAVELLAWAEEENGIGLNVVYGYYCEAMGIEKAL